ncbi:hypothetical protein HMPREF1207_05606 [Paenibacillus sp. HGH0039]|nr:hypothetical protein HMPREF1207_05606 [Paenibacillus sp. HGH0039]
MDRGFYSCSPPEDPQSRHGSRRWPGESLTASDRCFRLSPAGDDRGRLNRHPQLLASWGIRRAGADAGGRTALAKRTADGGGLVLPDPACRGRSKCGDSGSWSCGLLEFLSAGAAAGRRTALPGELLTAPDRCASESRLQGTIEVWRSRLLKLRPPGVTRRRCGSRRTDGVGQANR